MVSTGTLSATTDLLKAIEATRITFVCVGTPSREDGGADLFQMETAARELGSALAVKDAFHSVMIKSTVPPGSTLGIIRKIIEKYSGKRAGEDFGLGVSPEFLRTGSALRDSMSPDRLIFGIVDSETEKILRRLYEDINCPKLYTDVTTAEMIKYCSNAFLATKISFANEFSNLCEVLGVDVDDVFEGVGLDRRISADFFQAGIGFGGSCFTKDINSLITLARSGQSDLKILEAVLDVNEKQYSRVIEILDEYGPVDGKTVTVLGLAFKGGTDDVRETRSLPVIEKLLERGARIKAYDPKATEKFMKYEIPGEISYVTSAQEALKDSHAVLLLTGWEEFRDLPEEVFLRLMARPLIIDGRRMFSRDHFREAVYRVIGSPKGFGKNSD
jgi:UDPglucose 6-dehydrogenase